MESRQQHIRSVAILSSVIQFGNATEKEIIYRKRKTSQRHFLRLIQIDMKY